MTAATDTETANGTPALAELTFSDRFRYTADLAWLPVLGVLMLVLGLANGLGYTPAQSYIGPDLAVLVPLALGCTAVGMYVIELANPSKLRLRKQLAEALSSEAAAWAEVDWLREQLDAITGANPDTVRYHVEILHCRSKNPREAADVLIAGLRERGFVIVPAPAVYAADDTAPAPR